MEEIKSETTTREIKVGDVYWITQRYLPPKKFIVLEILPNDRVIGEPSHLQPLRENQKIHSINEIILDSEVEGRDKEFPTYLKINDVIFHFITNDVFNTFNNDNTLNRIYYVGAYKPAINESGYRNRYIAFDDPSLILNSIDKSEVGIKQSNYDELIEEYEEMTAQQQVLTLRKEAIQRELKETQSNCPHATIEKEYSLPNYDGDEYYVKITITRRCTTCLHETHESISISSNDD